MKADAECVLAQVGEFMSRISKLVGIDQFIASLVLHCLLPLLPLGFEKWATGGVSELSLSLAAAMYFFSVGISSKIRAVWALSIFGGFAFAVCFGVLMSGKKLGVSIHVFQIGIVSMLVGHAIERIARHVYFGERYIQFLGDIRR